jgi:hypothetical protein
LDQPTFIQIDQLSEWAANADNHPEQLILYINGRALKGLYPEGIFLTQNALRYHLQITPESKEAWQDLLGEPVLRRPVTVTVGPENAAPFDTAFRHDNKVLLAVIPPFWSTVCLIIVLATFILFVWLARHTNLIRDPGGSEHANPYNLGRTQMAFWFFLIFSSYTFIWLVTGELDTITPSLLVLMGISAGTALSDAVIDANKQTIQIGQQQNFTAEKQMLDSRLTEIDAQLAAIQARMTATPPTATPDDTSRQNQLLQERQEKQNRRNQVTQSLSMVPMVLGKRTSVHFFEDLLSDNSGYSFHRFQIFAWTLVLGVIFVASVYNTLSMPDFSQTLLGLMGISSGTYIGFKFPEQKS